MPDAAANMDKACTYFKSSFMSAYCTIRLIKGEVSRATFFFKSTALNYILLISVIGSLGTLCELPDMLFLPFLPDETLLYVGQ